VAIRHKAIAALAVAGGALLVWRRRSGKRAEKVDLYYDDGSMVTLAAGSDEGDRLLPLARRVLAAARA
jgi:hypothetical protein